MDEKKLYHQKKQAQLDEWKAELDKLKAQASVDSVDEQLRLNKQIEALEVKLVDGKSKLAKIADASEDAWESLKDGVESAWDSMKSAFSDTTKEKLMNEKKLYQQKKQAQLDEWKAKLDKLKAQASGASAEAQLKLNKQIEALEVKLADGKTKLAKIANASEDAWESLKDGVETAWDSMKSAFNEAADRFKK